MKKHVGSTNILFGLIYAINRKFFGSVNYNPNDF